MITCGCRCMACKSTALDSHSFTAPHGYEDIHHTCRVCGIHFNHLDGEIYTRCETCGFPSTG